MQYLRAIQSNTTTFVREYFATLREAFSDINTFTDDLLESELARIIAISIIIATPIVGTMIFLAVISASA